MMTKSDTIPKEVRFHLNYVLQYLWDDEKTDYLDCYQRGEGEGHVFESLVILHNWANPLLFVDLDATNREVAETNRMSHIRKEKHP